MNNFKSFIACSVAAGASFAIIKDRPGPVAATFCGGILAYGMIDSHYSVDRSEVEAMILESNKLMSKNMKIYQVETKKRYSIYRKIIKKALIKRFKVTEIELNTKIRSLSRKMNKKAFKREVTSDIRKSIQKQWGDIVTNKELETKMHEALEKFLPKVLEEIKKNAHDVPGRLD